MLKNPEIDQFRAKLLKTMDRLDKERQLIKEESMQPSGGEMSGGISSVPLHIGDLGSHEAEEDAELRLVENEEYLMKEINDALDRIEQGSFGRCESCRHDIPKERLAVVPYTRYCVSCATTQEQKKRF